MADADGDKNNTSVSIDSNVSDVSNDSATVTRSASLAEVVSEPQEVLEEAQFDTDFELFDKLLDIDPELAGSVRSQAQMASGFKVIHPAVKGDQEMPTQDDKEAMEDCEELVRRLSLELSQPSIYKNMIAMGNDINKILFTEGEGVTGLQSLPLRQLTIIDEDTAPPRNWDFASSNGGMDAYTQARQHAKEKGDDTTIDLDTYWDVIQDLSVQKGDFYVLNEGTPQETKIEPWKILHFSVEKRSNWFTDKFDRDTYGIWGAPRLEPTKFSLQAKHNTLTNKVAMDDSLIAREVYKIDVEALFGHISNDEKRTKKAEDYATNLSNQLESMDPDDKPILPNEVSIEVHGPEGKAREHGEFLNLMNDSIMHALTFNIGGVGRDAGGPMIGNRPAKDQSLENVMHLRQAMSHKLRELFRIHLVIKHPEWREQDSANPNDVSSWRLKSDITTPRIEWDPIEMGDRERVANVAAKLFKNKVLTRNEARELMGFDPLGEDMEPKLFSDGRENEDNPDDENTDPSNDVEDTTPDISSDVGAEEAGSIDLDPEQSNNKNITTKMTSLLSDAGEEIELLEYTDGDSDGESK